MTVSRRDSDTIGLEGTCGVEDAEPLLQLLLERPSARVDWRSCDALHTAVVQVILARKPTLLGPCGDRWIEEWIGPHCIPRNSEQPH